MPLLLNTLKRNIRKNKEVIFVGSNENLKEIDFFTYCKTCKHRGLKEIEDPCNECLDTPCNAESCKPLNWEPAKKGK